MSGLHSGLPSHEQHSSHEQLGQTTRLTPMTNRQQLFDMEHILRNMEQSSQNLPNNYRIDDSGTKDNLSDIWAKELIDSSISWSHINQGADNMPSESKMTHGKEQARQSNLFSREPTPSIQGSSNPYDIWARDPVVGSYFPMLGPLHPSASPILAANRHDQIWEQEFDSKLQMDSERSKMEANKLAACVQEEELKETDFLKFINKIGTQEIEITENGRVIENTEEADLDTTHISTDRKEVKDDTEFWANLAKEWDHLSKEESESYGWLDNFDNFKETAFKETYSFSEENPLREVPNPFEEGVRKLEEGDIPSAVYLFEAACQQNDNHVMAWQYLGTTQAENEHDPAAILALKKCLQLDPGNLTAMMALAVSYTNESFHNEACNMLKKWIKTKPEYTHLVNESSEPPGDPLSSSHLLTSICTSSKYEEVRDLFLKAARMSPSALDPDVQAGILF